MIHTPLVNILDQFQRNRIDTNFAPRSRIHWGDWERALQEGRIKGVAQEVEVDKGVTAPELCVLSSTRHPRVEPVQQRCAPAWVHRPWHRLLAACLHACTHAQSAKTISTRLANAHASASCVATALWTRTEVCALRCAAMLPATSSTT